MTDVAAELELAAAMLRGARNVVVCAHVNPDGDAVGATLGLTLALRAAGIDATPTLANCVSAPVPYAFLPGFPLYRSCADLTDVDVFCALDTPNLSRLQDARELAESAKRIVVLDHHPDNARFGAVNVVDPDAAAVGQMVWRMLPGLGVEPTPDVAMCLYTALMTDTGRFSYGNTDPRALRDAAAMIEAGADPHRAYELVYEARTAAYMRLLGVTLARVAHANSGKVAYSYYTAADLTETGAVSDETEDLIDFVRSVGDVDVVFVLKQAGDETRVSLRSKDGFDVAAVARKLGGGGHSAAAGASVAGGIDEALAAVLPLLPGWDADGGGPA